MRRSITIHVILTTLALAPAALHAALRQGDWEFTLAGTGASGSAGFAGGLSAGLGYFLTDQFELAVRQQAAYSDIGAPAAFFGQTKFALDFNITLAERWQPFIGAQVSYQYGDLISAAGAAGPELGIRYFVHSNTFIYATAEYDFFFSSSGSGSSSDDQFAFSVGIGFKF